MHSKFESQNGLLALGVRARVAYYGLMASLLERSLEERIDSITYLAHALGVEHRDKEAERLFKQALVICEDKWPEKIEEKLRGIHCSTVRCLRLYGSYFMDRTEYASAQPLFERAIEICFALKGSKPPAPAPVSADLYGQVLCDLGYCYWQVRFCWFM